MSKRNPHTSARELADKVIRDFFGGQGDKCHACAPCRNQLQIIYGRMSDVAWIMDARLLAGEERTFEMNTENARLSSGE